MAQYGRYKVTVLNSQGQPVVGASVTLRKQGATVNGLHAGPQTVFTVNDCGALTDSPADTVRVGTGVTERTVTDVDATSITVSGAGFNDVADDARLTVTNNLPTIYNDAQGAETKANPLTTDSAGRAECWALIRPYDAFITGGADANGQPAPDTLIQDEIPDGVERLMSTAFDGASAVAYIFDTFRALSTSGAKIISVRNNAVEKFYIDKDGNIGVGNGVFSGTVTVAGLLTASNGFTLSAGTLTLPAGSVETADLAANAIHPASSKILGGSGDVTLTTSEVVRATTTYTPVSGNVGVMVTCNFPYIINGGINTGGRIELRLYIGGTLKATGILGGNTGANEIFNNQGNIAFTWIEPTMAASPTAVEVREIRIDTAGTPVGTYKGTLYQGYMTIQEFKK